MQYTEYMVIQTGHILTFCPSFQWYVYASENVFGCSVMSCCVAVFHDMSTTSWRGRVKLKLIKHKTLAFCCVQLHNVQLFLNARPCPVWISSLHILHCLLTVNAAWHVACQKVVLHAWITHMENITLWNLRTGQDACLIALITKKKSHMR